MKNLVNVLFESDKYLNSGKQLLFAIFFPFFTIIALGIESASATELLISGRKITNILAVLYFSLFFWYSEAYLRKLMFVMVFLSYIGELIFCTLLEMYHYRTADIPLYVPFGHAIVYASGFVFAHTKWALSNEMVLRKCFDYGFVLLFLGVGYFLNDIFSLLFSVCFFYIVKRKRQENLYYFIALCVIFIELVGTYFQCWKWVPNTFGVIPTANPPMGAVFFYAGGDVLLSKIVSRWKSPIFETI